jgi:hypothetical protein
MIRQQHLALVATLLAVGATGVALADDTPSRKDQGAAGLEVTMRIIEDPAAISPDAITRRLTLPVAGGDETPPGEGQAVSETAREAGRESGEDVAERARELAERASEQREEFGRSRAEELRPEPPGRPEPPVPPRP